MAEPSISNLKRRAAKVGLRFFRSNWRKDSIDNLGSYQVVDVSQNLVVDGSRFDLELSAVRDVIEMHEAA